jgi:AraC-like DNA-binding protein
MNVSSSIPASFPLAQNVAFSCVDVDELENYLESGGLIEQRKLTLLNQSKSVNAHVSLVNLSQLKMVGVHLGASVIARSVPLRVAQLIIPMQGRIFDRTMGDTIVAESGRSAIFHMPNKPVDVQWETNTSALVVRIPIEYFKGIYESLIDEEFSNNFQLRSYIDLTNDSGLSLLNIIKNLIAVSSKNNKDNEQIRLAALWEELLVTTLFTSEHSLSKHLANRKISPPVYTYVKRTCDYISSNLKKSLVLEELVSHSGVSVRTLQNGFRKTHGLGPMAYVRKKKLEDINRELRMSEVSDVKIAKLARKWGFQHASHFTRVYKKQFDELPSVTLTKSLVSERVSAKDDLTSVV